MHESDPSHRIGVDLAENRAGARPLTLMRRNRTVVGKTARRAACADVLSPILHEQTPRMTRTGVMRTCRRAGIGTLKASPGAMFMFPWPHTNVQPCAEDRK